MSAVSGVPARPRLAVQPARRGVCGAGAPDTARLGGRALLVAFSLAAVGAGAARALTTTYLPVLLERIDDAPTLIGAVMTVNAVAGLVVPLAVGAWSDRRRASGFGRRLPFMVAGTLIAAGGLIAVALGSASSYLALGLAAAVVYTGLNALTTLHRTLVVDDVGDDRRPAVSSAQEVAATVGAGIAVGLGAAFIEPAPGLAFVLGAVVLVAATVPTLIVVRRLHLGDAAPAPRTGWRESVGGALRLPGAREVLLAQGLWVFAYAALPAFFVLYARDELGVGIGIAGVLPLAFGLAIAAAMVLAGRARGEQVHPLLLCGAALLGVGLLLAGLTGAVALAAVGLAVAGAGAGVVTALGFPYFARFIPDGEAGTYSGAFFAVRGIAGAVALPTAGLAVELSGTYRSVLWLGVGGLLALAPLIAAERRRPAVAASRPRPASVAAVMPVFASARAAGVGWATLDHVDELVIVDDGAPPEIASSLAALAADGRVRVVTLETNGGKGTAVATGIELLLSDESPPEAIVVLDSDGQHDPGRIPALVEASRGGDVVIGWRGDRRAMPAHRRLANRAASLALLATTRRWLPDTQNGMRLFRIDALREVPLPPGRYESESRHLRSLVAAGRPIVSVQIPTIYDGEPSHFRPLADTFAVARALLTPSWAEHASPVHALLHEWGPRLAGAMVAVLAIGLALPVLQPLDNELFLAINGLGDGPEWVYQAFDPHGRNYAVLVLTAAVASAVVLRRARYAVATGVAVVLAGLLADGAWEVVKLFVERARPEEVLSTQVALSHDRTWADIGSFPSGHLLVTSAMAATAAAAVPALRGPLLAYVGALAVTRVLFGAHFPIDVLAGAAFGHQVGLFTTALLTSAQLLPERPAARAVALELEPAMEMHR